MKKVIGLVVFVCLGFSLMAQKHQNTLLWKVEGKNLKEASYLFGTVHMICADSFYMPEKVKKAIEKTKQSYLEINLTSPDFAKEAQLYMKDNKTISSQISNAESTYIDSILKQKVGIPLTTVDSIKPLILMSMMMQRDFKCPLVSFEQEVVNLTHKKNQQVYGLSSVQEQYSFMDKIVSAKDFAAVLASMQAYNIQDMIKDVYEYYKKEDVGGLNKMMEAFNTTNPDAYHYLLTVRNNLWVDRLREIMQKEATFIAVGSAHLSGDTGMIKLLQAKGYTVTPVFK